jgi:glycosyltransferase involved in cell wall biosynthesis
MGRSNLEEEGALNEGRLTAPVVLLMPRSGSAYGQDYRAHETAERLGTRQLWLSERADYEPLSPEAQVVVSFNSEREADIRALEAARALGLRGVVHHQLRLTYLDVRERLWCQRAFACADAVIVPAEFLIEPVRAAGARHVMFIPNGVNFDHFWPLPESSRQERRSTLGIPSLDRVACWVGRLGVPKGRQLLEQIATLLPKGWTLIVQTPRKSADAARYLEGLPRHGGAVRVFGDPGGLDRSDHWIPASDLVISTSLCETVVMPVLEGLAAGVPILSTESTPYMQTLRAAGFVEPDLRLVPLPPDVPLQERRRLRLAEGEVQTIAAALVEWMQSARPRDDEDRHRLSGRARSAGLMPRTWSMSSRVCIGPTPECCAPNPREVSGVVKVLAASSVRK